MRDATGRFDLTDRRPSLRLTEVTRRRQKKIFHDGARLLTPLRGGRSDHDRAEGRRHAVRKQHDRATIVDSRRIGGVEPAVQLRARGEQAERKHERRTTSRKRAVEGVNQWCGMARGGHESTLLSR